MGRVVPRKTKPSLEAWNFQPHPPFSGEERRARNGVSNWSCLHEQASTKIRVVWDSKSFPIYAGKVTQPNSTGTEATAFRTFQTSPYVALHLAVHLYPLHYLLLYNKWINLFPWVLWVYLASNQIQEVGGHGNLTFVTKSGRSCE